MVQFKNIHWDKFKKKRADLMLAKSARAYELIIYQRLF